MSKQSGWGLGGGLGHDNLYSIAHFVYFIALYVKFNYTLFRMERDGPLACIISKNDEP